jgi:Protein of unknown function (DUF2490)
MNNFCKIPCLLCMLVTSISSISQKKEVISQQQTWASINSTIKLNKHWGFIADIHIRQTNFFNTKSFYFLRGAANYWIHPKLTVSLGYAHMWLAPNKLGFNTFANENRIYQQAQLITNKANVTIVQRVRSEQRWIERIVQDKKTDTINFSQRIRYLASFTIPVFKNKKLPSLVVSDEIFFQFGKHIVYNTFDQNRLFVGIKQQINTALSFDAGYMYLYQQRENGYQYNANNTYRLFFYFNPNFSKK